MITVIFNVNASLKRSDKYNGNTDISSKTLHQLMMWGSFFMPIFLNNKLLPVSMVN